MIWRGFLEVNRASGGLDDRKAIKGGEQGQDDLRPWHAGPALASEEQLEAKVDSKPTGPCSGVTPFKFTQC